MSSNIELAGRLSAAQLNSLSQGEVELIAQRIRNRMLFNSIAGLLRVIGRGLAVAARPIHAWWARTQVHDELMGMDDRMLADIGISRADVPAVAAGRYQGHPIPAPRLVAEQVKRARRSEIPAAHNDQATPRVA